MREHGTTVCYRFGPDGGSDSSKGCRCDPCRAAVSDYERQRRRRAEPAYVSANVARTHLIELAAHGIGLKQVAKASKVSHGALSKIMYGVSAGPNRKARPPSRRIRQDTHAAILAVTPADVADGAKVPAGPTLERIQRLIDAGVPKVRIAERLGQTKALQIGTEFVTARHARAITQMAVELHEGTLVTVRRSRHGITTIAPAGADPDPDLGETVPWDDVDDLLEETAAMLEARIDQARWRARAACAEKPTWMFFPLRGDQTSVAAAKAVCATCPVSTECLETNMEERDGIFGGTSGRERRLMRSTAS